MPTLNGTSANDVLNYRTAVLDLCLEGFAGNDKLFGGLSADKLDGGAGADTLIGGGGDDSMAGGAGKDMLYGGAGNDRLYGGGGGDSFVFRNGDLDAWTASTGGDTILDFQGAGGRYGTDAAVTNDFIAFTGFGTSAQGAHLDYIGTSTHVASLQFYAVTAAPAFGGHTSILTVNLADHTNAHLVLGDYNFY